MRVSDEDLEVVLGHRYGVRAVTLEESGVIMADHLTELAARAGRRHTVGVRRSVLTEVASLLGSLTALSREGT